MRTETDPARNSHKARLVGRSRTGRQAPLQLVPAEALTSTRDRYWRFTNQTVPSERAVPIWASELEWFLAALAKLVECPTDLTSLPYADVPYPFAVRPAGTTMLLLRHESLYLSCSLIVALWVIQRCNTRSCFDSIFLGFGSVAIIGGIDGSPKSGHSRQSVYRTGYEVA